MTPVIDACYFHGHEPIPPNCYRVCVECGHAYATPEALLEAENVETDRINAANAHAQVTGAPGGFDWEPLEPATRVDDIYCCPLCSHDW